MRLTRRSWCAQIAAALAASLSVRVVTASTRPINRPYITVHPHRITPDGVVHIGPPMSIEIDFGNGVWHSIPMDGVQ